ncbi:MAG TPA: Rieske 2Fe-2S domain-containing protein [Methylomirabilota bacterium]|nr:Rieske 2Fe-2S domain-containing protein [Methylomirabilota bacterium]
MEPARRGFLKRAFAVTLGAVSGLIPFGAGLAVFLDPLRRSAASTPFVRVTSLESLPPDGIPRKFPVIARRSDAWTTTPDARIGAVYLRRLADGTLQAFNVTCPHAGCFVEFAGLTEGYRCPCHDSSFTLDGAIKNPGSPSPRGLDELETEIRNGADVWVKYQKFLPGHDSKIPA